MKNFYKFNKLRNRVWLYFVVFTVLLVCLIWLLQTVFFEYNYQRVRGETMNVYADLIASDVKNGTSINKDYVTSLKEASIEVLLVKSLNGNLSVIYPSEYYDVLKGKEFDSLRIHPIFVKLCERVKALIVTKQKEL